MHADRCRDRGVARRRHIPATARLIAALLLPAALPCPALGQSAGEATLSHSEPGHLANGEFALAQPLEVSLSKSAWSGPASNDAVTIAFTQAIGADEPLRTGTYSRTLTFTLSTTEP